MFRKRIILIGTIPPPIGGDAMWAKDYIEYNKKYGIEISLVNTSLIGKRAKSVDENRKFIDEMKRSLLIWSSILKKVSKNSADIVHMNINCSKLGTIRDLISVLIIKIKRVPFVVHCHCNIIDQIGNNKFVNFALKSIFKLSNKVIVLNESSYEFVVKQVKDKAIIIPNFIKMDQFFEKKQINKKLKNIVYVGHIRKTKGISELLEVAKKYSDLVFTLVGPITDDYTVEEIINDSIGNIKLTGSVLPIDVNKYLDQADVFLFPSYTEGFSRALVEAMARGIPCIATNVGSNENMLENKGGIIIKTKDSSQIFNAIKDIYDFETRRKMSKWNYNKAIKNYSIESVMELLFDIYEEIINEVSK